MTSIEPDDLVRRAIAGDQDAVALLWREHRRWLAAVLLAHKPRDLELEDLLQDTAMSMVRHIKELREPAALRPWLRTLALNGLRSAVRRRNSRGRRHEPLLDEEALADPAHEHELRCEEMRETSEQVLALVARLHPDYREPLLLRCVHGQSQKQIAAILDLPETTVETRLARARRSLRAMMQRAAMPYPCGTPAPHPCDKGV